MTEIDTISGVVKRRRGSAAKTRRAEPAKPSERAKMSSPDRVVDAIIRGIRAGQYVPGQRLIEADLTRGLSVSRGPVREALKRLAAEGVLTLTRHRGAYVRSLSREEVRDSLMVLETLTGLMARLAARRIGEGKNGELLRAAYKRLLAFRDTGGSAAFLDERRHFYDALIAIGKNRQLARLMPLMQIHLLRMQFQSYVSPRDRQRQFEEYEAITSAVLAGDATRAERVTKLHIRRTRISLMRLPDDAFHVIRP